jgi:hypothetical protein
MECLKNNDMRDLLGDGIETVSWETLQKIGEFELLPAKTIICELVRNVQGGAVNQGALKWTSLIAASPPKPRKRGMQL